jgi:outer membrane protein TolC
MRGKSLFIGLALILGLASGCKQQLFLSVDDYKHYQNGLLVPLENNPTLAANPVIPHVPTPANMDDPDRPLRYMSLAEAIAIALEQGTIGNSTGPLSSTGGFGTGLVTSLPTSNDSATISGNIFAFSLGQDNIRILRLDPARLGVVIDQSLSKFDTIWSTSATWTTTDRPVASSLDVFSSGAIAAINQEQASISSALVKPLPTGGVAGITFLTNYTFTNQPAKVNPAYQPQLQFQFEQPLLQGFGVEINQINPFHPGSVLSGAILNSLTAQNLNFAQEGILISRIRFDQQRAEFERAVMVQAANVENAYWNLYYAYWNLYAQEQLLRLGFVAWNVANANLRAGRGTAADLAQARNQYEQSRAARLVALSEVLRLERELRGMLGMLPEDGHRIVPSDSPTLAPYRPDWNCGMQEALVMRPELYEIRQEVKANQLKLVAAKNLLLPDLRFFSTYDLNGLGSQIDGPSGNNAFRSLASNHFNDWQVGLRLNVPLGFRSGNAAVRRAQLDLARSYEVLRDQEEKLSRTLAAQFNRVLLTYQLIEVARLQREAATEQLRLYYQLYQAGRQGYSIDIVLRTVQSWSDTVRQEFQAIRDYNQALVGWEFAKGSTLLRNNIVIGEGMLPEHVQVRAVEHQRERSMALELRERPQPPTDLPHSVQAAPATQVLTPHDVPALPDLLNSTPLLKTPQALPAGPVALPSAAPIPAPGGDSTAPGATGTLPDLSIALPPARPRKPARDPNRPTDFGAQRIDEPNLLPAASAAAMEMPPPVPVVPASTDHP